MQRFNHILRLALALTAVVLSADTRADAVIFTTVEDHADMMRRLGITRLRPGPSGNASAPNAANYDEALANPYPVLPEVLTLANGEPVRTAEDWWSKRRPELVALVEREVYGRVPDDLPPLRWLPVESRTTVEDGIPVFERRFVGRMESARCPEATVEIALTLVTPETSARDRPVLIMFGRSGMPGQPGSVSRTQQLLEANWGYAWLDPTTVQADNGAGLTRGVIGLANGCQPRRPDDWGALRAWAWGAARALDLIATVPGIDAARIGIEGVSRYGKAALVAMAFDNRFAMVLVGSSGEGGAKLHRRNFGEAVENLTAAGEYHWMAGNFLKYGAEESAFGRGDAGDLPVDAHQLIALCAPRLTFISYGIPEQGDALWLDQRGSFMAAVAAGPVFRLLGAGDLGTGDDYPHAILPAVNEGLLDGALAWRQHDGGHTDTPNIPHFIRWAEAVWSTLPQ